MADLARNALTNPDARELLFGIMDHCLSDVAAVNLDVHAQYTAIGRQQVGHMLAAVLKEANPVAAGEHITSQGERINNVRKRRNPK